MLDDETLYIHMCGELSYMLEVRKAKKNIADRLIAEGYSEDDIKLAFVIVDIDEQLGVVGAKE